MAESTQSTVDPHLAKVAEAVLDNLCRRHPMGYRPQLVWRGYRVTAGLAYYRKGVIGLSYRVLTNEQALRDTLTHEYAHLLAVKRHGVRAAGHGDAWKQAMFDLGQEPVTRHKYPVERNVPRQRVTYVCLRCGGQIIRNRRLPQRRHYVHANCGGDLRLSRVERVTGAASAA